VPLYRNASKRVVEIQIGFSGRMVPVKPEETVNLDSHEIEIARALIEEKSLLPASSEFLHHKDTPTNQHFVETIMAVLDGAPAGTSSERVLQSIQERTHWFNFVSKPEDALVLIEDLDKLVVHVLNNPEGMIPQKLNELRDKWLLRRDELRRMLIPTAWERLLLDFPDP
jgi:hypothetical protein